MASADTAPTPYEFSNQLIRQVFSDLDGILLDNNESPVSDAFALVAHEAATGTPRGSALVALIQGALAAYPALLTDEGVVSLPQPAQTEEVLVRLVPGAAKYTSALSRYAQRVVRYFAEAEPAGEALPLALANAIQRLYRGMMAGDSVLGGRGLIALRTLVAHVDAIASLLDPAGGMDRPIRAFAPDRFHDHFIFLTEQVRKPDAPGADQPVAALTLDGRITAIIAAASHPMEAAAAAVRERVGGDSTTREHALLRMQGLLHFIESRRLDKNLAFAEALHDETAFVSLVTAAATTPMREPGRFGARQLLQIARFNRLLLQGGSPTNGPVH